MGDSVGAAGGSGAGSGSVSGGSGPAACRQEPRGEPALQVAGFQQLSWLLPKHTELTEMSFMLLQLLLGQPVRAPPQHTLVRPGSAVYSSVVLSVLVECLCLVSCRCRLEEFVCRR